MCESTLPGTAGIHRAQWTLVTPMLASDSAATGRAGRGGGGGAGGGAGTAPPRDLTCDATGGRTAGAAGAGGGRGSTAPTIAAGTYTAKLTVNGHDYTKPVSVLEDIWMYER